MAIEITKARGKWLDHAGGDSWVLEELKKKLKIWKLHAERNDDHYGVGATDDVLDEIKRLESQAPASKCKGVVEFTVFVKEFYGQRLGVPMVELSKDKFKAGDQVNVYIVKQKKTDEELLGEEKKP